MANGIAIRKHLTKMKISIISSSVRNGRTSHGVALALEMFLKQKKQDVSILDLKELALPEFLMRFSEMKHKPPALQIASDTLQQSNAVIFLTPEYNGSITSALKNCIDIFGKAGFAGKPIGVATASAGIMRGVRAAYQLQQIILALQAYPQPQMLLAGEVTKQINEQGEVINPMFQNKLEMFVNTFLAFSQKISD
jgi:NAD(P)H-dependent FMN reductase